MEQLHGCCNTDAGAYRRMAWGMLGMGPRYGLTIVHPDGLQLQRIADLISQGKVKPVVDRVFPLEQAACGPGTPWFSSPRRCWCRRGQHLPVHNFKS